MTIKKVTTKESVEILAATEAGTEYQIRFDREAEATPDLIYASYFKTDEDCECRVDLTRYKDGRIDSNRSCTASFSEVQQIEIEISNTVTEIANNINNLDSLVESENE